MDSLAGGSRTTNRAIGSVDAAAGAECIEGALRRLCASIDGLLSADLSPVDADAAVVLVRALEVEARRLASVQLALLAAIDQSGLHQADGHSSVRTMVRHVAKLSNATASARVKSMQMLRHLPLVAERFAAGEIGSDQVNLLGRVHANPRVAGSMPEFDEWFCRKAMALSYSHFEAAVRHWERLADADGPEPANNRNHEQRNVRLVQNSFDLSWDLLGSYAAFQGASMREIFDHFVEAELAGDWEKAKAELGDNACYADLPRTDAQRRADALWSIFQDAAAAEPSAVPPGYVHNIVWDAATFEEMVARLDEDHEQQDLNVDGYRCETIDGTPLEPTEAVVNAMVSALRRVVVDARGVTIDLGQARLFTGNARHAVQLSSRCCVWPGCEAPASKCEIDHLREHARGGRTNPGNGAVMCGKHNRWKQKGYSVRRDQAGNWRTYRPSGAEVP